MLKSDRLAATAGVLIAFSGLVVSILCPLIGAAGGAAYAATAFGAGVLAKTGLGFLGAGIGFSLGKVIADPVLFAATMTGAAAVKTVKACAGFMRRTRALFKFGLSPVAKNGRPKSLPSGADKAAVFTKISGLFKKSAAKKPPAKAFSAPRHQPQALAA